ENPEEGLGLAKRYRDAKILTVYEGTSNIQRNIICQGAFITELKKFSKSIQMGLRFYLLKNSVTKRLRYRLLKHTAKTPLDRVNAAYQFSTADGLSRYNGALQKIKKEWKNNGIPTQYQQWDAKSLERQQNLLASLPVQARMQLIADMATYRKMMELGQQHLKFLSEKASLTPEDLKIKDNLILFEKIAEESVIELGRKIGSASLKHLEDQA
ncbi:MAG: hypothetical protein K2X66_15970, partial [Cyanobacteria bacterium]|nr:hypothetical protein [Cyanobacteriota bacterium]